MQARYPAKSVTVAMFSCHSGRSRKPLWSIRVSATATTRAELDDMPEASGSVESMTSRAGRSSPKLRASRSITACR